MSTAIPPDPQWPGYTAPSESYVLTTVRHTSHTRLLVMLGGGLIVVVAAVALVSWLVTPPAPHYSCPPNCGRPPIGPPVGHPVGPPLVSGGSALGQLGQAQSAQPHAAQPVPMAQQPVESFPRFTPSGGEFSVSYPDGATLKSDGVVLNYKLGDIALLGTPAHNRTPREIAEKAIAQIYPGATLAYEIPNAMVGYQPGYGEVDDFYPQSTTSSYTRLRLLVMVAEKNGYALIAAASGPYHEFKPPPDGDSDHPSGTNFEIAGLLGGYINSFMWRGDPPR